jgi:sugar phosphate isomerase/epimerase
MTEPKQNLRWAYMDHWRIDTEQGQVSQYSSVERFDSFVKQIAALGFEAIETFDFHLGVMKELFGSLENCRAFLQERGIDRVLSLFHAIMYDKRQSAPQYRETHDHIVNYAGFIASNAAGLGVENLIVMPAGQYHDVEPVTDDKIRACAEVWSRVGKRTLEYGIKTCCHHEFYCGIHNAEQIRKFYEWSDPRYVYWYCDTAQHVIAGVDPVDLYVRLHDRCGGFHLKDTHNVDINGDYRQRPESEVTAPTTRRWFWEMGTEEGLVDFPALFNAMKEFRYQGWVSVEHDKADVGGSNYPESTAIAAWYIQNVLKKIYA